ncbi:iron chelate uptake ABC transporter family permease subunit, partial [Micromonospora sp. NPDC003776]
MIVLRLPGGLSLRLHARALAVGLTAALLTLALAVLAVATGDHPIHPADVLRVLAGGGDPADRFIVTELRLPRLAAALAVGAALGVAGRGQRDHGLPRRQREHLTEHGLLVGVLGVGAAGGRE